MTAIKLDDIHLLAGTFLVKEEEESEQTTRSGLVLSTEQKHKVGTIIKASGYEFNPTTMKRVGPVEDYVEGDKIIIDANTRSKEVKIEGQKYLICTRENIVLVAEQAS